MAKNEWKWTKALQKVEIPQQFDNMAELIWHILSEDTANAVNTEMIAAFQASGKLDEYRAEVASNIYDMADDLEATLGDAIKALIDAE